MDAEGQRNARVISEVGVSMAVEMLLRAGFNVAIPIVDEGYDLIATHGRRAWRLQVKATAQSGQCGRRIRISRGKSKCNSYDNSQVDAFVAVHTESGYAMCVPFSHRKNRRWINFSDRERYSDFRILHKVKPGK